MINKNPPHSRPPFVPRVGVLLFVPPPANIEGDVVGRDKTVSAGTYIEHATFLTPSPAALAPTEAPAAGEQPFKGLEYFNEADADLFFGRELLTAKLVGYLRDKRFLAIVVGASGSGKSSVVRAGIIPALKRGAPLADNTLPPAGSAHWLIHLITPTSHPVEALAADLTRDSESVTATATLIDDMFRDARSLHLAARRVVSRASTSWLLLIVDQFEELFTLCKNEDERRAFVDNLMAAVEPDVDGPVIVVIALRADFYSHCAQYASLREALSRSQEYIGPMSPDELRRAIEEPAKRGDWEFEPGLVDLLVREVGDEPGALPLLSHALLETWKRRQGRMLTLKGYEESGGVHGAIATTAERVFNQLDPAKQLIARNIFLRLVELGEGGPDTRRRASINELISRPEDVPAVEALLKVLVDARLITTGPGTVEVAHEALIRSWRRLADWLDADREFRVWHDRLRAAMEQWTVNHQDEGALVRGATLVEAEKWLGERALNLSQDEQAYIRLSAKLQVRERAARDRLRRRITISAITAAVVLALAAVLAVLQWQQAEQQRRVAQARQWSAQASLERSLANGSWTRAGLLAIESMRQVPSLEASMALVGVLDRAARPTVRISHPGPVTALAVSPDGQYAASGYGGIDQSSSGAIIWNVSTGAEVVTLTSVSRVNAIAFSAHGDQVATGSDDGTVRVWNAMRGQELLHLQSSGPVQAIAFNSDDSLIVSGYGVPGTPNGGAIIWNLSNGAEVAHIDQTRVVNNVAFSPDDRWIVVRLEDGSRSVWEATSGHQMSETISIPGLTAVAFSHNNSWLALGNRQGQLMLRDLASGRAITWTAHAGPIWNVAFSPNDDLLASGSDDFKALVWNVPATLQANVATGIAVARLEHDGRVDFVEFSHDSVWLLTQRGNVARIWDVSTGREVARIEHASLAAVLFDWNARAVLSGGGDSLVRVWDVSAMLNRGATTGRPVFRLELPGRINSIAISPDGKSAISASENGAVDLWEVPTLPGADATNQRELIQLDKAARFVAFSPGGKWVVAAGQDGSIETWEADTGRAAASIQHGWDANTVAFSPDGRTAVSGAGDGSVLVWEIDSGKLIARMDHGWEVNSVAYSTDGRQISSASRNGTVRVWDATTGQPLRSVSLGSSYASIALSPEGQRAVTGSGDGLVQVWDLSTGHEVSRLKHPGMAISVAFSPDGRWIVSSGQTDAASAQQDGTARVWEAATGREVTRIQHRGWADSVGFSQDGRWVTSITYDTALVWWWKPEDVIKQACSYLTRNLTDAEWEMYLPGEPYRKTCENLP